MGEREEISASSEADEETERLHSQQQIEHIRHEDGSKELHRVEAKRMMQVSSASSSRGCESARRGTDREEDGMSLEFGEVDDEDDDRVEPERDCMVDREPELDHALALVHRRLGEQLARGERSHGGQTRSQSSTDERRASKPINQHWAFGVSEWDAEGVQEGSVEGRWETGRRRPLELKLSSTETRGGWARRAEGWRLLGSKRTGQIFLN